MQTEKVFSKLDWYIPKAIDKGRLFSRFIFIAIRLYLNLSYSNIIIDLDVLV